VLAPWRSRRDLDDAKLGDRTGTLVLARPGPRLALGALDDGNLVQLGDRTGNLDDGDARAGPRSTPVDLPVNLSGQPSVNLSGQLSTVRSSAEHKSRNSGVPMLRFAIKTTVVVSRET
jgi:hypothetical protein